MIEESLWLYVKDVRQQQYYEKNFYDLSSSELVRYLLKESLCESSGEAKKLVELIKSKATKDKTAVPYFPPHLKPSIRYQTIQKDIGGHIDPFYKPLFKWGIQLNAVILKNPLKIIVLRKLSYSGMEHVVIYNSLFFNEIIYSKSLLPYLSGYPTYLKG